MRPTDKTYRPDIDGLRAFAVLAVMGFHAAPSSVRGGFVGVDVFFVISGFLITSIILRDLDAEKFSIKNFYVSRICRIFPALIVMLVATLLIGWLILLPDEFKELGRHIAAAPLFSSNFLLLQESGYFERAAEQKPLLHLWSLSIEEQFYLLWPVTLIALWKSRLNLVYLIGLIAFVSFELNIYLMQINPSANFYIPLTRFWEILLGALLAVIIRDKEFIGIISSYFNPPNEKYRSLCQNIMSVSEFFWIVDQWT